jgi:hypothetical protein
MTITNPIPFPIWDSPEILDKLYFIPTGTENLGRSRNSGPVEFHSYSKSGQLQKFWTRCISFIQKIWGGREILDLLNCIHRENLGRSRNSGPVVFHSYRKSGAVQKFWTRCISFIQKILATENLVCDATISENKNNEMMMICILRRRSFA